MKPANYEVRCRTRLVSLNRAPCDQPLINVQGCWAHYTSDLWKTGGHPATVMQWREIAQSWVPMTTSSPNPRRS